jgi:HAD superfamily hydrolase (TIGR01509 family)
MSKSIAFDYYKLLYMPEKNEIDNEVIKILASLKRQGIPLYLFTNTSEEFVIRMNKKVNFLKYFKKVIYNREYPKPDAKAFQKLIENVGDVPSNIVFVDDALINIQIAQQFGIIAIQYLGPKDLKDKLYEILRNDN